MPQSIVGSATWAELATAPIDGDLAATNAGAAPLVPNVLQLLVNRDLYLATYLSGTIIGPCVLHSNGGNVTVEQIGRIWLGGTAFFPAAQTITASGLTPSTFYYVYAYNNAGAFAIDFSTTEPEDSGTWKLGGTTRRFLGSFFATGATTTRPFRTVNGVVMWSRGGGSGTFGDFQPLGAGTSGSWADISMATWAPPFAKRWMFDVQFLPQTATNSQLDLRAKGNGGIDYSLVARATAAAAKIPIRWDVNVSTESGTANAAQYQISVGSGSGAAVDVYAIGYVER